MEQKCEFVCENSSLTVSAFIPSVSFIAGHHIPVTVSVAKEGYSQTVRSIGIKLIQLEKNRPRQTKLSRVKWKDFISPGDVTYEMDLLIPKNTTPKTAKEGCPRRYEVQVSVKIAHSKSCRLCLPVRIEAVGPIRGRVLEADNDVLIPMFAFK